MENDGKMPRATLMLFFLLILLYVCDIEMGIEQTM